MAKRKYQPARTVPADKAAASGNRILIGVVAFYVAVLGAMVVSNRYVFLMKGLIVPVLVLAALLSGRFKRFVNDWAVFLGAVVFFDFGRGLAFALTSHFELPMYLDYVIRWERWLCAGAIAPAAAQQWRAGLADPTWLDRFFVLVYSSHYLFFLVFGFLLWQRRRAAFRTYVAALLAVMYGGLLFYFLVPTIPPWMAANDFLAVPKLVQIVRTFYNTRLPLLLAAFDVNAIAAMPSLHCALPATCALFALRYFGRRGWFVVGYMLAVWAAVVYLGEHYFVDVIAGFLLALVVHAGVVRWGAAPNPSSEVRPPAGTQEHRPRARRRESRADKAEDEWAVRPIAVALVLVTAAAGLGQLSARWFGQLPITREFVARELMGRNRLAHYYLGRIALAEDSFAEAADQLRMALDDLPEPEMQKIIRPYLGVSASRSGDFALAIAALEPLRQTGDVSVLGLLADAYAHEGQYEKGLAMLRDAQERFPADPEPLYWLARVQYERKAVDRRYLEATLEKLRQYPTSKAETLRQSLAEMLQAASAEGGR